jgi:3-hydroxyisobutyrate dehydrogenase
MVEKTSLKVGWIGTGVMGKSMVGHLMKHGHQMMIFNRTTAKCEELIANGAVFATPL